MGFVSHSQLQTPGLGSWDGTGLFLSLRAREIILDATRLLYSPPSCVAHTLLLEARFYHTFCFPSDRTAPNQTMPNWGNNCPSNPKEKRTRGGMNIHQTAPYSGQWQPLSCNPLSHAAKLLPPKASLHPSPRAHGPPRPGALADTSDRDSLRAKNKQEIDQMK